MTHTQVHCGCGPHDWSGMFHHYAPFMPYDLEETDAEYLITMPLPGFQADAVHISMTARTIYIEATPPEENNNQEGENEPKKVISMGKYLWNRKIRVEIPVNEEIEEENVKAKLNNGLLKVRFRKKPKKTVKVEEE